MPTKTCVFRSLLVKGLLFSLVSMLSAAPAQWELRHDAAFLLTFGTLPEVRVDGSEKDKLDAILAEMKQELLASPVLQAQVARRAMLDSLGIAPDGLESDSVLVGDPSAPYKEQMKEYLAFLEENVDVYRAVVKRAYSEVIHREVYDEEWEYWSEQSVLNYVLLVGCLEDWARRNQPGLMVTGGETTISVNCEFLTTLRVPPALASELRGVLGLPEQAVRAGAHVLAPGASTIISSGGVHFLLAGSAFLHE